MMAHWDVQRQFGRLSALCGQSCLQLPAGIGIRSASGEPVVAIMMNMEVEEQEAFCRSRFIASASLLLLA